MTTESLIDRLEKFAGVKLKAGRNVIKGYPVNLVDSPDYIDMEAVDKDACTGLVKALRAEKFKAKRIGDKVISITEGIELFSDLLDESVKLIKERREDDVSEILEKYIDQEKMYSFEGPSGIRKFEKLVKSLNSDYRDLDTFLEDNPGCFEVMIEWIASQRSTEWVEGLQSQLKG